jgi:hypothetical protein
MMRPQPRLPKMTSKKPRLLLEGQPIAAEVALRGEQPVERATALPPKALPIAEHIAETADYVLDLYDAPQGPNETLKVFRIMHRKYQVPLGMFSDLASALLTMSGVQSKLDEVTKGNSDKVN